VTSSPKWVLSHPVATLVLGPHGGRRVVSVDGGDAFCMPTALILAAGMSINSPGSGLEVFAVPRASPLSELAFSPSLWFWSAEEMRGRASLWKSQR